MRRVDRQLPACAVHIHFLRALSSQHAKKPPMDVLSSRMYCNTPRSGSAALTAPAHPMKNAGAEPLAAGWMQTRVKTIRATSALRLLEWQLSRDGHRLLNFWCWLACDLLHDVPLVAGMLRSMCCHRPCSHPLSDLAPDIQVCLVVQGRRAHTMTRATMHVMRCRTKDNPGLV